MLPPSRINIAEDLKPWWGTIVLLPCCVYFALTRGGYTFMDHADLILHEAGHIFFAPFGWTLRILGGTLLQILVPFALAWSFFRNDYLPGTQIFLFWTGHSLINVSVYAADARARQLNLITDDPATHDWWNLLRRWDLLSWDGAIGTAFFVAALAVFAVTLYLPRRMWA